MEGFIAWPKAFWRGSNERGMPVGDAHAFDTDRMMAIMEEITSNIAGRGNAVVVGEVRRIFCATAKTRFACSRMLLETKRFGRVDGQEPWRSGGSGGERDKERMAFVEALLPCRLPTRSLYHLMIKHGDRRSTCDCDDREQHAVAGESVRGSGACGL